jgi:hypothetical protein
MCVCTKINLFVELQLMGIVVGAPHDQFAREFFLFVYVFMHVALLSFNNVGH